LDGKSGDIHGLRSLPQGLKTENSDKLTAPIRMMNEIYSFVEKNDRNESKEKEGKLSNGNIYFSNNNMLYIYSDKPPRFLP
jgi:hypothetical protein